MELLLPLPLRLNWPARDCRTPVTIVTVCQLLRASATLIFFFSRLPWKPTWTRELGRILLAFLLRTNLISRDKRNNSRSGSQTHLGVLLFCSPVRTPCNYLPVGYKINPFPSSLPLPSSSSEISIIVNATFCNDVSARPPLPARITLRGHKPKYRYPRLRATRRRVSGSPLCSVRSWFCHGFQRFAGARTGKFRCLNHQRPSYLDSAE